MAEDLSTNTEATANFENPQTILARMEENVGMAENMDPQSFVNDVLSLRQIGATEKPAVLDLLRNLGTHPPIWSSVLDFLESSARDADPQKLSDYLQAGKDLGMDQNPQIAPLFQQLEKQRTILLSQQAEDQSQATASVEPTPEVISPEANEIDREEAQDFAKLLLEVDQILDSKFGDKEHQINLMLEEIHQWETFKEIDPDIQSLALNEFQGIMPSVQDILKIKRISEKLAKAAEEAGAADTEDHQFTVATVALALNQEIAYRANKISEQNQPLPDQPPAEASPQETPPNVTNLSKQAAEQERETLVATTPEASIPTPLIEPSTLNYISSSKSPPTIEEQSSPDDDHSSRASKEAPDLPPESKIDSPDSGVW